MPTIKSYPISLLLLIGMLLATACTSNPTSRTDRASVDLPATFRDQVRYPGTEVSFEMVLIPGDAARGIEPFYIGQTEVTWAMFRGWSYAADLESTDEVTRELDQGLRPSELYADRPNAQMGFGQRPAIGMTYDTAQLYCDWLSKKTGRAYRLPTDREWSHVLRLSGGMPSDPGDLLGQGVFEDNAPLDDLGLDAISAEVASKSANPLGLYDLLGNAAEWVQSERSNRWVRGGHFQMRPDAFKADWRSVEDFDIWNASSPQLPSDASWYIDHYYQGIRLVCEIKRADEPSR